jgi:hypothetical protein
MKKTWLIIMMTIVVTPLVCMEKKSIIQFMGDPVVSIKESNLCLMKTLHKHYKQHQNATKSGGILPRYEHVSEQAIALVNDALNVRPDKFADFYQNQLTPFGRQLLIKASGQYDEHGKSVMLDVPEITKRLIDVYFTDAEFNKHIKQCIGKDDEDYARNYFKEQLICSKRLLSLKQPMFFSDFVPNEMYLGSLFIDAAHTIDQYNYSVPLRIENDAHETYAISFGGDNYEYRITDVNDKQCLLWVINHDDPSATFSTIIKTKNPIKGCRISSTNTDVEYALTYSKDDIVLSTITMQNGATFVESKTIDILEGQIVDVCFDYVANQWLVGLYEGLESVIMNLGNDGNIGTLKDRYLFGSYGLLEKIIMYQKDGDYFFDALFGVSHYRALITYKRSDNGMYELYSNIPLVRWYAGSHDLGYWYGRVEFICRDNSLRMIRRNTPFFVDNNTKSFLEDFWAQPKTEIHRVYSSDGSYLMCNTLKKNNLGILYVETVIKDAATRKDILSIDTLYNGFRGVGFTCDTTELIFLSRRGPHYKVSLLNYEDKQVLSEVDDIVCSNLGVASLVKRLCQQCKENSMLALQKDDSTRAMLMDWSKKSPTLLKLLEKCLPIAKMAK